MRTFYVIDKDCIECENHSTCKDCRDIPRDKVYQSLKDAKLYTHIFCMPEIANGGERMFLEVTEKR